MRSGQEQAASASDPLHTRDSSSDELGQPCHLHDCRDSAPTRSTASYDEMGCPRPLLHGPALLIRRSFPSPVQAPHKIRRSPLRPVYSSHNFSWLHLQRILPCLSLSISCAGFKPLAIGSPESEKSECGREL